MKFKDCNIYYTFEQKENLNQQDFQAVIITDIEKQPQDLYEILKMDPSLIKIEHLYEGHLPSRLITGFDESDFIIMKEIAVYYVRFISSLTKESVQKIIVSDLETDIYQDVIGMYDNVQKIEKVTCILPYGELLF